jgi:hypothetical protein
MAKKRKKKRSLSGTDTVVTTAKKAGSTLGNYGLAAAGVFTAILVLQKVDGLLPASTPPILKKIGPGLVTSAGAIFAGTKIKNEYLRYSLFGVGTGAAVSILFRTLSGKIPFLANLSPASLSGMRGSGLQGAPYKAFDTGDYPASYYKENAFQGLGNSPFALNGLPMNGSPFALNGLPMNGSSMPYALN